MPDAKNRYPLFMAAFYGRVDCVAFLLDLAAIGATNAKKSKPKSSKLEYVIAKDVNGDTAAHAASLNGNMQCILLLLYYIRCSANKQGLSPAMITANNNSGSGTKLDLSAVATITVGNSSFDPSIMHSQEQCNGNMSRQQQRTVQLINSIENRFRSGETAEAIYGCTFEQLSSTILYYGSRWVKCYDASANSYYYYDRCAESVAVALAYSGGNAEEVAYSQWEQPETYDETELMEYNYELACEILRTFYTMYNPEKMWDIDAILLMYRGKYSDLFLQLANRYQVTDMSIFNGIDFNTS